MKKHLNQSFIWFCISWHINQDFPISFVIGTPLLLNKFTVENKIEYQNLKNIIFILNVGMKFIILLHEFKIHLLYGYIYYISEKRIYYESPKGNKINGYGGFYYEKKFFWAEMNFITVQEVILL